MHFLNPIAERIHDELEDARVGDIEGVPAPGEIDVVRAVGVEPVVAGVVDAAHGEDGTGVVAFGGVVVNDIQNHLDPCGVESADHFLEFVRGVLRPAGAKPRIRHKISQRVVAPVVHQPPIDDRLLVRVEVDRHQLDGGDSETLKMGDRSLAGEARIGAAQFFGNLGMALREAFDMQFVENRFVPGGARGTCAIPGEGGIEHAGEGGGRRAIRGGIGNGGIPNETPRDGFRVRIEEDFVRVKAVSRGGVVRAVDAVSINKSRPRPVQVAVPDLIGFFGKREAARLDRRIGGIKQTQFDERGILGKQREVHPLAIPGCAQRCGFARPDGVVVDHERAEGGSAETGRYWNRGLTQGGIDSLFPDLHGLVCLFCDSRPCPCSCFLLCREFRRGL